MSDTTPAELLSQSPNPRPMISAPPPERSWTHEQLGHLVREYNAMIHEIEKLSAHIVHLGGRPHDALAEPAQGGD